MSTLQVPDPRLRARSRSRSAHSRERSRSRDSRAPRKYDDSDSEEQRRKARSRSRSSYRESSKYDHSQEYEDDIYRPRERSRDRYHHSDTDEDEKYYRADRRRHSSPYASDSEHSDSDSDLDALAYGDTAAVESSMHYRPSASPERRSHARSSSATYHLRDDDSDREPPGSHPSYARPERFSYAQPPQFTHAQPAQFRETRHASYSGAQPQLPKDWAPIPECEMPGYVPPSSQAPTTQTQPLPGAFPAPTTQAPPGGYPAPTTQPVPGAFPAPVSGPPDAYSHAYPGAQPSYANLPQWQYANPDPNITYSSKSNKQPYTQSSTNQFVKPYTLSSEPQFEMNPAQSRQDGARPRPHSLSVSTVNNLSVGGGDGLGPGGRPPASPLLEPYQGTYQSISPMPSPIASPARLSPRLDEDVSDLEPLDGGGSGSDRRRTRQNKSKSRDDSRERKDRKEKEREREREKSKERKPKYYDRRRDDDKGSGPDEVILISPSSRKKVSFYNPTPDALALKEALLHHRLDPRPFITILPYLTSDEVLALRAEYKKHAKLHGKGINIAKHIKMRLDGNTPFGKVCYATALGRWESEAYWANYYYQAGTSRRELLIESLMGRTNAEIREIKACFRDSRYADSLEKCMKAELKADKFRMAILLALEERRQPERDTVDVHLVQQDVHNLHRALVSREGGETAMIKIIVVRSDSHLREVLRVYESIYRQNFARAMIAKSRNLVVSKPETQPDQIGPDQTGH